MTLHCHTCTHPYGAHAMDPRNGVIWCRGCHPGEPSATPPRIMHVLSTRLAVPA